MTFRAPLWRYPGPGGWTFVNVPPAEAPAPAAPWGRAPVAATVDGVTWPTSVWHDRERGPLLAVPARVRRDKGPGDVVEVTLAPR